MPLVTKTASIDHLITTMRGQLQALYDLRQAGDVPCVQKAKLIRLMDGEWSAIRRASITECLDHCSEWVLPERRDGLTDHHEAIRLLTRRY